MRFGAGAPRVLTHKSRARRPKNQLDLEVSGRPAVASTTRIAPFVQVGGTATLAPVARVGRWLLLLLVGLSDPALAATPSSRSGVRSPDEQAPVAPLPLPPAREPRGPLPSPPPKPPAEQPIPRALRLYAPPDCIDEQALVRSIADWIGVGTLPITWAIVVKVEGAEVEFAIFEVGRLVALRRFEGLRGGCKDAETVLGAALGLSLESLIQRRREQAPTTLPWPAPDPTPARRVVLRPRPFVTAQATFALGMLLEPAWGGGVYLGVPEGLHTWSRLGVVGLLAQDAHIPLIEEKTARISSRLVALHFGQCWSDDGERLRTSGCVEALGGALSGVGRGDVRPLDATLPFVSVGAGATTRLELYGPLALTLAGTLHVNVVRPTFRLQDPSGRVIDVRQPSEIGLTAHAGVTWVYR